MKIATAEECRTLDQRAISEFGVPIERLMEAAGRAIFEAIRQRWNSGPVAILAGKGHNGGDALVVARLCLVCSLPVRVAMLTEPDQLSDLARLNLDRFLLAGGSFTKDPAEAIAGSELIVDGLLGTRYSGTLSEPIGNWLNVIRESGLPVVAVDIPSGLHPDSGLGEEAPTCVETITFGWPKRGFFQGDGPNKVGAWRVGDIGFPQELLQAPARDRVITEAEVRGLVPIRPATSHKGTSGRVLIVAGSEFMPGAAVLAVQGALRAGAGLVGIDAPLSVRQAVAAHCPEAILVNTETNRTWDTLVIGPGLGSSRSEEVQRLLAQDRTPIVVDADALAGLKAVDRPAVLTPHPGEMARLLGRSPEDVQSDRFGAVREAASRFQSTVVLKGAWSLVCDEAGLVTANPTGNPGMATGGMGDVLAGVIGAYLAAGLSPAHAARLGVWLHGAAGDICASQVGPVGFTASQLASAIPAARAKLVAS